MSPCSYSKVVLNIYPIKRLSSVHMASKPTDTPSAHPAGDTEYKRQLNHRFKRLCRVGKVPHIICNKTQKYTVYNDYEVNS